MSCGTILMAPIFFFGKYNYNYSEIYINYSACNRQLGQARHNHLRSNRGNLNFCVCVYYNAVVMPAFSVETEIMCMDTFCAVALLPVRSLCSYRGNFN